MSLVFIVIYFCWCICGSLSALSLLADRVMVVLEYMDPWNILDPWSSVWLFGLLQNCVGDLKDSKPNEPIETLNGGCMGRMAVVDFTIANQYGNRIMEGLAEFRGQLLNKRR